ncbi:MAG: hypothetical protein ACJ798_16170 [Phenylobacterium sp.]
MRSPASGAAPGGRLEVAIAFVIATAGLGASWASYQAGLWHGAQAIHYGRAGAEHTAGMRAALEASSVRATEIDLFSAWLNAHETGNERLASLYEQRFPETLASAFHEWIAQHPFTKAAAASSPFKLTSYRQPALAAAEALDTRAERELAAGQDAIHKADAFMRAEAMLAMAMFFGGISQVFSGRARIGLAAMGAVVCGLGLFLMFSLPLRMLH